MDMMVGPGKPNIYTFSASSPTSTRAVNISSFAIEGPTTLGSRCVPPAPGIIANLVSTNPIFAVADATRKSQANAISRPPP